MARLASAERRSSTVIDALPAGRIRRSSAGTVRADLLRGFQQLVESRGGNARNLMVAAGLSPGLLRNSSIDARIEFSRVVELFNLSVRALRFPDFGLQLAALQSPIGVAGPVALVLRNSETLGSAIQYAAEQVYAYSECTGFNTFRDWDNRQTFLHFEVLVSTQKDDRQLVEHAIARLNDMVVSLSGERARPREIWFAHHPIGPLEIYRRYFACEVRFRQSANAVIIDLADENAVVVDRDDEVYRLAKSFVELKYLKPEEALHKRVRKMLLNTSLSDSSMPNVCRELGMHPRTFQRRLREEGYTFNAIKDEICKDIAAGYLVGTKLPLIRIANMLGYSELSAFSHKCRQWFACSPREYRVRFQDRAAGL